VVLDRDPYEPDGGAITDATVRLTIIEGSVVYEAS